MPASWAPRLHEPFVQGGGGWSVHCTIAPPLPPFIASLSLFCCVDNGFVLVNAFVQLFDMHSAMHTYVYTSHLLYCWLTYKPAPVLFMQYMSCYVNVTSLPARPLPACLYYSSISSPSQTTMMMLMMHSVVSHPTKCMVVSVLDMFLTC